MDIVKDLLASLGIIFLLMLGMTAASAGYEAIINAFDRSQAGQAALIAKHKAYLASDDDHYVTDPTNGFDDEAVDTYEASEEYKTARHANLFIANAYGRD